MRVTRRGFLQTTGLLAGAFPLAKWGPGAVDLGRRVLASGAPDPTLTVEPVFARPANGLNVILVVLDTLRKDHVGAYGNPWVHTPNLDRFAARSTRFTRAIPESLPTVPVRRALHTGIRTFPFRDWTPQKGDSVQLLGWQRIPDQQETVAELLERTGYTTALISDTPHLYSPSMNFHRGFGTFRWIRGQHGDRYRPLGMADQTRLEGYLTKPLRGSRWHPALVQYVANTDGRSREEDWLAPRVFREAARWLEDAANLGPFFLLVDSFDPHEPWDPPSRFVELYDDRLFPGPEPVTPFYGNAGYLSDSELNRMRHLYAAEVSMVDEWLGRLLATINDLGLIESTMIAIVSDHGILIGEHGVTGKPTHGLWPEVVDVPLMIGHPDHGPGIHEGFVSTHDVAPTILGALGMGVPSWMEGRDLMPYVAEPARLDGGKGYTTAAFHDWALVRTDTHELHTRTDFGETRLYDIVSDPRRETPVDDPGLVDELFGLLLEEAGGELVH